MKKRQRKKNNRTPNWLRKLNKKHKITIIRPSKMSKESVTSILQTGYIGQLFGCSIVTDPVYPWAKLKPTVRGQLIHSAILDDRSFCNVNKRDNNQ